MGIKHKCLCLWVNINIQITKNITVCSIVVLTPPSQKKKKHPHFLALYICKLSKPPFLGNSPFHSDFSVSPQNISFSYLTQSYHLKVTEFFVMTEKNIFAYKLFLSLNIPDFKIYIFSL